LAVISPNPESIPNFNHKNLYNILFSQYMYRTAEIHNILYQSYPRRYPKEGRNM